MRNISPAALAGVGALGDLSKPATSLDTYCTLWRDAEAPQPFFVSSLCEGKYRLPTPYSAVAFFSRGRSEANNVCDMSKNVAFVVPP